MTFVEPAYAGALDWLLCDALGRIAAGPSTTSTALPAEDGAYYFRLSTRPIDQAPFEAARARVGDAVLRRAGARRRLPAGGRRRVAPRARRARHAGGAPRRLRRRAARGPRGRRGAGRGGHRRARRRRHLARPALRGLAADAAAGRADGDRAEPAGRAADGVPATARRSSPCTTPPRTPWRGSARRSACRACRSGVDQFGQSGSVHELYELHDLLPGSIVNAALAALSLA